MNKGGFSLILIFALLFQTVGCAKTNVKKEQTDASQIIENIKRAKRVKLMELNQKMITNSSKQIM